MTSTNLITLARKSAYGNAFTLSLAAELRTAGAVDAARSRYAKRVEVLNARALVCFYVFLTCAVVLVGAAGATVVDALAHGQTGVNPMWCANALVLALLGLLATAFMGVGAATARDATHAKLLFLAPVTDSTYGRAARDFIDAGEPEVLAWCDRVVEERGQLCVFDTSILQDIQHAARAARDATRIRDAYQTAARLLFSITPESRVSAAA